MEKSKRLNPVFFLFLVKKGPFRHCSGKDVYKRQVRNMDSIAFLTQSIGKFDLAFLDPPYLTGTLQRALPLVVQIMNAGGTIICEHPSTEELPLQVGDFVQVRSYRYGKILLTLYRHKDVMGR